MTLRTKGEQKAYLDGYTMCADCIKKYLTDEDKQKLECLLAAVRTAVDIEDETAIKILDQQPSEDEEVIKVSKGAVKARQGRFVIYDVEWLKKNFYVTEEKIYGQPKDPCENCISKEAALNTLDYIDKVLNDDRTVERYKELLQECYEDLPSVTLSRSKGKWIHWTDDYKDYVTCSCCEYGEEGEVLLSDKTPFCPICGADMREREE